MLSKYQNNNKCLVETSLLIEVVIGCLAATPATVQVTQGH